MANYFQNQKLELTLERNKFLIQNATAKFANDIGIENVWNCKKNTKVKTAFPQDIVRLFDNTIQIAKQLYDIEESNPNDKVIKQLRIEDAAYKALRYT